MILTQTAPGQAGKGGCVRGQALHCTEGATGSSTRIFPQKKKTLWGTLWNSPVATAPVSSPPHHPSGDCAHLIWEGAETTGTTWGRVTSKWECAHPPGSARTSSWRELRLQAPPWAGCPATGSVPIHQGVITPHLRGSSDYRHHPGQGALQLEVCTATWECLHLISEGAETTGTPGGGCTVNGSV